MVDKEKAVFISVKDILQEHTRGEDANYKRLILQLCNKQIKSGLLLNLLNQLKGTVFLLNSDCEQLVVTVLQLDWMNHGADVQQAYMDLVVGIASAQTVYLHHILQLLLSKLSSENLLTPSRDSSVHSGITKDNSWLELCYATVHSTIQSLLKLVPTLPKHLIKAIWTVMPSISSPNDVQVAYINNLFHVTSYLPELRKDVLELVVNRITELDVHCPRSEIFVSDDDDEDDDLDSPSEQIEGMQFDMEDVSTESSHRVASPDVPSKSSSPRLGNVASTLDDLMYTLLTFCKETCHNKKGEVDLKESRTFIPQLFQVFGKVVLPTHASNHVQYSLFYVSSLRKSFADAFLDYLWKKFVDPSTGSVMRQSAASYIASLLSRGDFIALGIITASLELMAKWIHSYIDNQEMSTRIKQDVDIHRPFYSLCQAMFYIIVYHYKDLLGSEKGNKFVMSLNLDRIVSCKLNPLSFSLPSIVNIFATITRRYQVVFCYTILERNARVVELVGDTSTGYLRQTDIDNPLGTFFPFDPYLLPKSGAFIKPLYIEWEGCGLPSNSQTKQSEDEEDEFRIYEEHLQEVPLGLMPSSLSAISPGFMSP